MDSGDYLEEGFDPSKLRVADLRKIFIHHDVEYTSGAKKAELVQIFKNEITPQAEVLRKEFHGKVQPTDRGIVDADPQPRRRTRSVSPAKSPAKQAPKPATAKSTVKKSPKKKETVVEVEEDSPTKRVASMKAEKLPDLAPPSEAAAPPASPKRRGKRTLPSKQFVEPSEKEVEEPEKKASVATPVKIGSGTRKKSRDPSEMDVDDEKEEEEGQKSSPFSDRNIFQSGSPKETPLTRKKRPHPPDAEIDQEEKKVMPPKRRAKKSLKEEVPKKEPQEQESVPTPPPAAAQQPAQPQQETPGSILRHFTSFSSSPDQEKFGTPDIPKKRQTIPATVQPPQPPRESFDSSFSERKVNKRLSYMPNFHDLKMSSDFKQQLDQAASQAATPRQSLTHQEFSTPGSTVSDHLQPEKLQPETLQPEATEVPVDAAVKQLDDEIEQEKQVEEAAKKEEKKRSKRHKTNPWVFYFEIITLLTTVGLAITSFAWWRQEKIEVGYCNVGFVSDAAFKNEATLWDRGLDLIRPDCTPCPSHATCYPHFKAVCDEDFVYKESPFTFGMLPLAPKCEPDTEKQRRVLIMSGRILKVLRQRHADFVCGDLDDGALASIEQEELRELLYNEKQAALSDAEFDDLWRHSIKDIKQNDEVIVDTIRKSQKGYSPDGDDHDAPEYQVKKTLLQSTSMAKLSFACRVRRGISGSLERYRQPAEIAGLVAALIFAAKWYWKRRLAHEKRVDELTQRALDKLMEKQKASEGDTKGLTVPYIPSVQLRDEEMPNMAVHKRPSVWKNVEKQVESNTNVRSQQKEVHGEIMKVWQYVGN